MLSAVLLAATAAAPLDFNRVFSAAGEPPVLHYQGRYRSSGGAHDVEVWRDGDRRLKRETDGRITSFVTKQPGRADYRMDVLDKARKIHTTISRDHMYSIGGSADWFDMAHALRHPNTKYQLTAGKPPSGKLPPAIAKCGWYDLTASGRTSRICWDSASRLPLLILDNTGALVWRITAIDRKPIPAAIFRLDDRGYVKTDADKDIAAD